MTSWNLADIWEAVADARPGSEAQRSGERVFTFAEFDRRSNALAADLLDAGLGHQAKVAAYLYNGPEYLEVYFAAFKAGLAPLNVNYRYGAGELIYLLDNADAEAVVFHAAFAPIVEEIQPKLPNVRRWYVVEDGSPAPDWAVRYEELVASGADRIASGWGRSPDDLLLLYTGGTTGMPKGVMWRQDDLVNVLGSGGNPFIGAPPANDVSEIRSRLEAGQPSMSSLPACPLMHGTGQFSAFIALIGGGCVVTTPGRKFDPAVLWQTISAYRVNSVAIVGDAFARPMLAELDANPGKYDLSELKLINSSGVMWSQEVKDGLLRHVPHAILFDSLGSSEGVGLGASISAAGTAAGTAQFSLGNGVRVLTPDDRDVEPGSGETGVIALPGFLPVGYYKDPEKSERTWRVIDGVRYVLPGDYATVEADGAIKLLGRGSVVVNTGGEKVFPEEVEEVIKRLPEVADAVVVGIPDDRLGETVCAVVQKETGSSMTAGEVEAAVRGELAGYKVPRRVMFVESIGRSPAGKVDYQRIRREAAEHPAETVS
ncbi:MAG TPA: acyl-CoA synthetase [Acidimicrobiales bacterium]